MNVAIFTVKDITKYMIKMLIVFFIIYIVMYYMSNSGEKFKQIISNEANTEFFTKCLKISIPLFNNIDDDNKSINMTNIMNIEIAMLNPNIIKEENKEISEINIKENQQTVEESGITVSPEFENLEVETIENVSEKNYEAGYNLIYNTTKIDNESNRTITEDILIPDVEITNKTDILIFHTHTCESYTPCDTYNYTMTGNYRTTDSNYNVVRVGTELATELTKKGFNIIHDETYHDYPSYSGSYGRSLETVEKILEETNAELVIDIHRDAVGNGDTYGPTVMINGKKVAQLMFVIGTDGGGSEHPNWIENLKIAIKIQEKANEIYPGLFRPIIVRNSRYNQHVAKGACIIEVGATANTLGETLLSMQCLANVLNEVCK